MTVRNDTDATPDLLAAQARALDESGWGVRFRLFQPRNPAFWILVVGLVAGIATLIPVVTMSASLYSTALAAGVVAFAIYAVPWWIFLHHHDRYTPLPATFIAVAFVWGAVAATFWMAYNANNAVLTLYAKLFGHDWAMAWGAGLTAPFTEEIAKVTALVLLIGLGSRLVRSPYDGFVIGAFAGLGFQVTEDMLYAAQSAVHTFGSDQLGQAITIITMRGVLGIVSHTLWSAVFAAGLVWFLGRPRGQRNRILGTALMAFSVFAHFVWDSATAIAETLLGNPGLGVVFIAGVIVASLIMVVWVARRASDVEKHWLRDILAPEAARGTIDDTEIAALAGTRKDRKRYLHAHKHGKRRAHHVLDATAELAAGIADSHGVDSTHVDELRSEVVRLRTPIATH